MHIPFALLAKFILGPNHTLRFSQKNHISSPPHPPVAPLKFWRPFPHAYIQKRFSITFTKFNQLKSSIYLSIYQ